MNETPFFFRNGDYELFGVLHRPPGTPRAGFVFCHPFGEEKLWAHRVYVSFARALAEHGCAILRFDHMGHGDSDGDFEDSNVETHLADIACAVHTLRAQVPDAPRLGLFGLRLGATFAARVAAAVPGIDLLILWAPIVRGDRYMQELLRSNLTGQLAAYGAVREDSKALVDRLRRGETINVDGYELSLGMFEQVSAIDLLDGPADFQGSCLILQIGKPGQPPRKELADLAAHFSGARLETVVEEPFWREIKAFYAAAENLSTSSLAWLESRLG